MIIISTVNEQELFFFFLVLKEDNNIANSTMSLMRYGNCFMLSPHLKYSSIVFGRMVYPDLNPTYN